MSKTRLQVINKNITAKRNRLERCMDQKHFNLNDPQILHLSRDLDELVLLYYRCQD
ncbi:MAG TPA: aspartyl-phosphate phosphatase Spo0E family protein [Clostridiales bacterium]|nr:aspartyl-phosphate phosphatase Spo0E family protein [Clostridiales bacterium]